MKFRIHKRENQFSPYRVIQTPDQLQWLDNFLTLTNEVIALDTETTGVGVDEGSPVNRAYATCVTLCSGDESIYLDNYREYAGNIRVLKNFLSDSSKRIILHNMSYDKHILANHGLELRGFHADTLVMDFLHDTSLRGQHGLKDIANREWPDEYHPDYKESFSYFPLKKNGEPGVRSVVRHHYEWWDMGEKMRVIKYACSDTELTLRVYHRRKEQLDNIPWARNLSYWDYYQKFERQFGEILWKMERAGVAVSPLYLEELVEKFDQLSSAAFSKTMKSFVEAGVPVRVLERGLGDSGDPLNFGSPKQLSNLLYGVLSIPMSEDYGDSTSENALNELMYQLELTEGSDSLKSIAMRNFLEWRKVTKLSSTYGKPLLEWAPLYNNRIHPSINHTGASTMRVSCARPNLLNIPIRTELGSLLRNIFVSDEGRKLIDADLAQIEVRVMAHLSRDETMLDFIRSEGDMHSLTLYHAMDALGMVKEKAEVVRRFGGPTSEALAFIKATYPRRREQGKTGTFAIQYGAGERQVSRVFRIDRQSGRAVRNAYLNTYPGVAEFMDRQQEYADKFGYIRTMLGRYIHILGANSTNKALRSAGRRQATNYTVQGTARDIIMLAMLLIDNSPLLQKLDVRMLLQVYDEILSDVPESAAPEAAAEIKRIMEDPYSPFGLKPMIVSTKAEVKIGDSWGASH